MKWRDLSRTMLFFSLLALVLIVVGMIWGVETFEHFENLSMAHESHDQLLTDVKATAFYTMVCGSMVVTGVGILLIAFLHLISKTVRIQKEADALRQKNEAMEILNQQTQKLAHHQRLQTIGTLTSSIAHEINNLLTPIMGYSMMALEKISPEEDMYDDILEVYNASRKAKQLISRLSDLSRKNSSNTFRQVSPDEVIRKTLDMAAPAKQENVEIVLDLNCWDQRIHANEIQLSQLLLNLILNGFHAMEGNGGTLTIVSSIDETHIHISISDTGCGIPKDVLPQIFEPFFTTKEAGKGTGLGLSIAAQVVEDHHGSIKVNSKVNEGTTFKVSLPRVNAFKDNEFSES